jgi:hypothetical protein
MNWDIQDRALGRPGRRTHALHWATGGRFVHGHWFDGDALELTVKRFRETGEIYPV